MNRVTPQSTRFDSINDKVVVLSDGANGVGAATVERLLNSHAKVVFGGTDANAASSLIAQTLSRQEITRELTFVESDVTVYAGVYKLFKTAYDKYGRVDHAIATTTMIEEDHWFDPELTIESVEQTAETRMVLDVNLKGAANFAIIAIVFYETG